MMETERPFLKSSLGKSQQSEGDKIGNSLSKTEKAVLQQIFQAQQHQHQTHLEDIYSVVSDDESEVNEASNEIPEVKRTLESRKSFIASLNAKAGLALQAGRFAKEVEETTSEGEADDEVLFTKKTESIAKRSANNDQLRHSVRNGEGSQRKIVVVRKKIASGHSEIRSSSHRRKSPSVRRRSGSDKSDRGDVRTPQLMRSGSRLKSTSHRHRENEEESQRRKSCSEKIYTNEGCNSLPRRSSSHTSTLRRTSGSESRQRETTSCDSKQNEGEQSATANFAHQKPGHCSDGRKSPSVGRAEKDRTLASNHHSPHSSSCRSPHSSRDSRRHQSCHGDRPHHRKKSENEKLHSKSPSGSLDHRHTSHASSRRGSSSGKQRSSKDLERSKNSLDHRHTTHSPRKDRSVSRSRRIDPSPQTDTVVTKMKQVARSPRTDNALANSRSELKRSESLRHTIHTTRRRTSGSDKLSSQEHTRDHHSCSKSKDDKKLDSRRSYSSSKSSDVDLLKSKEVQTRSILRKPSLRRNSTSNDEALSQKSKPASILRKSSIRNGECSENPTPAGKNESDSNSSARKATEINKTKSVTNQSCGISVPRCPSLGDSPDSKEYNRNEDFDTNYDKERPGMYVNEKAGIHGHKKMVVASSSVSSQLLDQSDEEQSVETFMDDDEENGSSFCGDDKQATRGVTQHFSDEPLSFDCGNGLLDDESISESSQEIDLLKTSAKKIRTQKSTSRSVDAADVEQEDISNSSFGDDFSQYSERDVKCANEQCGEQHNPLEFPDVISKDTEALSEYEHPIVLTPLGLMNPDDEESSGESEGDEDADVSEMQSESESSIEEAPKVVSPRTHTFSKKVQERKPSRDLAVTDFGDFSESESVRRRECIRKKAANTKSPKKTGLLEATMKAVLPKAGDIPSDDESACLAANFERSRRQGEAFDFENIHRRHDDDEDSDFYPVVKMKKTGMGKYFARVVARNNGMTEHYESDSTSVNSTNSKSKRGLLGRTSKRHASLLNH